MSTKARIKQTKTVSKLATVMLLMCTILPGAEISAQGNSGVTGLWKTIDDSSGEARSFVRITQTGNSIEGKITKIIPGPGETDDPVCEECPGDKKNAKIVGMTILSHFSKSSSRWRRGSILDPENGKTYRSSIWLTNANTLRVRGYVGPFYRTQTWHRVE